MASSTPEHQHSPTQPADGAHDQARSQESCAHGEGACGCVEAPLAAAEAAAPPRLLQPAALRALAEAEERRQALARAAQERPVEYDGPAGLEPTRYGDWERKGIASDF